MIITIDGPTASGKSTVARLLAEQIDFLYLSSGLLFRGLAYCLHKECGYDSYGMSNIQTDDIHHCVGNNPVIAYAADHHGAHLLFRGIDITNELETPMIDQYASIIAINSDVRASLLSWQHAIANNHNVVVEGRDSGSTVFPQATLKFYLTASVAVRGRRWQEEQQKRGFNFSEEEAIAHIEMKDARDSERKLAPLVVPEDAITVDNSSMDIQETLRYMVEEIKRADRL